MADAQSNSYTKVGKNDTFLLRDCFPVMPYHPYLLSVLNIWTKLLSRLFPYISRKKQP